MTEWVRDRAGSIPSIDGYVTETLLGSGGMGSVYRATQLSLGQPVAIKVLAEAFRDQPNFVARFKREANLQASLQHPHVVPVFESGESGNVPYIVMRLIAGPCLRELMRNEKLEPEYTLEVLEGIASALDFAHGRGVLHLDVKPHNVLVEGSRHAWLADFGLTRLLEESTGLTLTTGLVGSFDYLAPEIARGEDATSASDIYSFGVTTFHALTGSLPFPSAHQAAALFAHASSPRPRASTVNPALPSKVDRVLQRCMAVDPAERPASALSFVDDLRLSAGSPARPRREISGNVDNPLTRGAQRDQEAPSWSATVAPRRPQRPKRSWIIRGLSIIVALAAAGALALHLSGRPRIVTPPSKTYLETVGGQAHTWANYRFADGQNGPLIPNDATIRISCRVKGYRVQDGNRWWYRVASKPWDDRYYVSADAFYNNGHTAGTLRGTPFVDARVSNC